MHWAVRPMEFRLTASPLGVGYMPDVPVAPGVKKAVYGLLE